MNKLTTHDYQAAAVAHILENPRTLLKAPTGSGKTLTAVEAFLRSGEDTLIVISPLNTFAGWERTLDGQSGGLHTLRYINAKKAGQDALRDLLRGVPGCYFIGWERFRLLGWEQIERAFIVSDECHRATNRKGAAHRALKSLPKDGYHIMMSATPAGNNLSGLWALARVLWPNETTRSYWAWVTEWLHTEKGQYSYLDVFGERNPGALWASLPSAISMPSVYTAEPVIHHVEVDLNPTQRRHYNELDKQRMTWLEENPLAPEMPGTLYMRMIQVTMAVPSIKQGWVRKRDPETDEWETEWGDIIYFEDDAKSSKADAVLEILSDLYAGDEKPPVMIYTHSKLFATLLTKRLQEKGYNARQFIGGMSQEERQWKIDMFGKEFDIMVATIATVAEGLDTLKDVCHNEIWCSHTDSGILNTQAAGRLSRQGQEHTVQRWVISARGTIETEERITNPLLPATLSQFDRLGQKAQWLEESLG